jgi:hypothetical protein
VPERGSALRSGSVSSRLALDLASILKRYPGSGRAALEQRLALEPHAPRVEELVELGVRALRRGASDTELLLAVGTLLALTAPPAGAVRH